MNKKNTIELQEAVEIVKEAHISEEGDLTFIAAVLIFIGYDYNWDANLLSVATGYDYDDLTFIINNFLKYEILIDGKINMEDSDDELENRVEVTLIAGCGSGIFVRYQSKEEETKKEIMKNTKSLNNYLFEQLHKVSEVEDMNTLELEMNKTTTMIDISNQILDVARLKLEIIRTGEQALNSFQEIDNNVILIEDKKEVLNNGN